MITKNKTHHGYILILTLLLTSTAVMLVTYIFNKGIIYVPFIQTMIQQEQAKMIARSGVNIALSQLSYTSEKKKDITPEQQKKQDPFAQEKNLLTTLLPIINHWQTFELKYAIEGLDGKIRICIMCENGKININKIYNFTEKKFYGEKQKEKNWKIITQELFKKHIPNGENSFKAFENFLKNREEPLNDVTELLLIKEFSSFKNNIWFQPPENNTETKKENNKKQLLFLTDLFTTHTESVLVEPWLLSESIKQILGFNKTTQPKKETIKKWLSTFKKEVDWTKEWKTILKPVYGKELQSLPQGIHSIFSTTFEPNVFLIFSYGTVGTVTQRLCMIVERIKRSQDNQTIYTVIVKKLYWL